MTSGWKSKKLGELCDIALGRTPSRGERDLWDEEHSSGNVWLSIADLLSAEDNVVVDSKEYISDKGAALSRLVAKGTLLVSFKLTLGRLAFAGCDLYTNEAIAALTIRDERELSKEFLFYFLHFFDWDKATDGDIKLKGKTLNKAKLQKIDVFYPTLPEQKKLVAALDTLFDGVATATASAERNMANAQSLFESQHDAAFAERLKGATEKRMDEVCAITSTLVDPRQKDYLELLHVGAGNIESKTGNLLELRTAREEGLISGKFLFDETMVLYSKIRPYLMKVARPDFSGLCSADMYPLSPTPNVITRDYLFHLLLSKRFTEYAIQGSARAGMPKVNREHLFAFRFWLPPVTKQKEIAAKLDALHEDTQRLAGVFDQKRIALRELQSSMVARTFAGKR